MNNMTTKELKLASAMLDDFSDKLASNCCNDWEFPEDWDEAERIGFVRGFHEWNGDPEEFDKDYLSLPDFSVAGYLAHILANN
jgi:hypothetical protein